MKKTYYFWAVVFAFLLFGLFLIKTPIENPSNSAENANIVQRIDRYIKQSELNGSVLVARSGEVIFEKSYGYADYGKNELNSSTTVFKIGSLTKQFTSMAILILEEQGLLNVTDTIDKYFPDYPNGHKITIHHLLTHTSGIADYFSDYLYYANRYYSPDELILMFKNKPLVFDPGDKYEYSNSNYILLGCIIEKVSKIPYDEFIKENIFIPLEMKNSSYGNTPMFAVVEAVGYNKTKPNFVSSNYFDPSAAFSAGALKSTVEDLYKWDQALYIEELIKKGTIEKMLTPFKGNYGYGWKIIKTDTQHIAKHVGYVNGFSSSIFRDINANLTVIVLTNKDNSDTPQKVTSYIYSLISAQAND